MNASSLSGVTLTQPPVLQNTLSTHSEFQGVIDALDMLQMGVLIIDDDMHVLNVNRVGRNIIDRADSIIVPDGARLAAQRSRDTRALEQTLTQARVGQFGALAIWPHVAIWPHGNPQP